MRRDPADMAMRQLEKLIGRDPLIRDILNPSLPAPRSPSGYRPAVDVLETDEGWLIVADVPGVTLASLRIRLEGHRLVVQGQRNRDVGTGAKQVSEREAGQFRREFLLPFEVRGDAIVADLEAGVLRIRLPRTGPAAERDIPIHDGRTEAGTPTPLAAVPEPDEPS